MTDPYYNPVPLTPNSIAKAADVNREFDKIKAAFAKLPEPTNIPQDASGTPRYIHLAFADSADGTSNFTVESQGGRKYLGIAANQVGEEPSQFAEDYVWLRIRGVDGENGAPGNDGAAGSGGINAEYTESRYIRSLAPPAPATGSSPAGTSLSPPAGSDPLWVTTARRDGNDNLISAWSAWERISAYPPPEQYNATLTYYRNMQVLYAGGTYICIVDSVTGTAPSGTAQANATWDVIAAPGGAGNPATPPSAFTATIDLTTSPSGVNLRTIADAAGYTGHSNADITFRVPNGVSITGNGGGGRALDTGTWPVESYTIDLTLVVMGGGTISGGGGAGGRGGSGVAGQQGGNGGDAVFQRLPLTSITIDSGGIVRGGGGGGAGGSGDFTSVGGEYASSGGGGGGGGRPNGAGGAAGLSEGGSLAQAGTAGTINASGQGGNGTEPDSDGGDGGSFGAAGQSSGLVTGGLAGYAIRRNGFTSPVTNNGTISGAVA